MCISCKWQVIFFFVDLIVLSVITDFAHFLCKERGFTCVSYVYSSFDVTCQTN